MLTSKNDLIAYIKRQLGGGVHNIEMTPEQINDCIENAIGYFEREVDGGTEDKILMVELKQGISSYTLDPGVMAIYEMIGLNMINSEDLFSQISQVRMDLAFGLMEGGAKVSSYVSSMQYFSMINQFLAESITYNFNTVTKKLNVLETVKTDGVAAFHVLWSTRNTPEMWNNDFIKEYSSALAMKQWGINMSKFNNATLVGGMQLNGSGMIEMADKEIERLRAELVDKHTSPLGIFVG